MAGDALVVSATVTTATPPGHAATTSFMASRAVPDTVATDSVDIILTVENPTTATPTDPATVTVTAVPTETLDAEPVTVTAE
ncbi:hypothetical protein [Streptomyces sp. URMC 124]|uniref:hypothetical protein n=1 Tax=Streptomyces sp. URMC 124 TaxID=3423405 RepID=UPI003F1A6074